VTMTDGRAAAATATGAELIAQALADEGVEYFFNLPGNGVYPMLDPLADHGIRYMLGLHEASVVSIADGYARGSGRVPFVNLYMVPGTANALSAIYIAHRDKVPMVVTSTQQTRAIVGRDAYASASDLLGMVRQFTKWSWEVTRPERLPEAIHRAFTVAATHPQGPVFLSLPFDLFPARAAGPLNTPTRPSAAPVLGGPPPGIVARIADRIAGAERILFICGKDVIACDAVDEVEALARELGAAVVSEPWTGVVAFPRPHELGLGEYSRPLFDRFAPSVVFGIGSRMFAEAIGQPEPAFPDDVRVVALGLDPQELGRTVPTELSAICDLRLGLEAIRAACRGRVDPAAVSRRRAAIAAEQRTQAAARESHLVEHLEDRPMSLARLATELNRAIDDDTIIVEHGTTSTPVLFEHLRLRHPRNVFGTGSSVQGWGTPAAIGLQLGRPDQPVLALVGDGGITFTCQALWSAGRYKVPATIVVLNNRGYRSMRSGVLRSAPNAIAKGVDFGFDFEVDVVRVAAGFGVAARRIEDPAELADVVRAGLQGDRPTVVEAVISPHPYPWV